jgi:hypothetical protein
VPKAPPCKADAFINGSKDPLLAQIINNKHYFPQPTGVAGTDSEEVWMITEESAILVMYTSLLGKICILPSKEAHLDDQEVIRDLMSMTMLADHRVLYGAPVARFLQEVKYLLQNPYNLLG